MLRLGEHFDWIDERRRAEWERERRRFGQFKANKQCQIDRREKAEDATEESAVAYAVAASVEQIEAFEVKLDSYDQAAVTALMENQEQLDIIQAHIGALLERAYVMEDGRRVFKTEDGAQVFDEDGNKVSRDELDYGLIGDEHPTWEQYAPHLAEKQRLMAEREQIIEFQEKVDAAREEVADGEISEAELEELDAELAASMPPPVRAHVPGMEPLPQPTAAFAKSAAGSGLTGTIPAAEQAQSFDQT